MAYTRLPLITGVTKTVPIPPKAILSEVPDRINDGANVTDGEAGPSPKTMFEYLKILKTRNFIATKLSAIGGLTLSLLTGLKQKGTLTVLP